MPSALVDWRTFPLESVMAAAIGVWDACALMGLVTRDSVNDMTVFAEVWLPAVKLTIMTGLLVF